MSDDRSPFALEALSAAQWDAVENAVFAELDAETSTQGSAAPQTAAPQATAPQAAARPRLWAFAGVALVSAAAAIIAVLGFGAFGDPDGVPVNSSANSTSSPGNSSANSSTRFEGGAEGAELTLEDVQLSIGSNAIGLAVGDSERGWVVALEDGRVEFAVAPREQRPRFVVQAAHVRVEVVGTRFSVNRDGERVDVEVSEGVVRVIAAGQVTELRAGEEWSTAERATEENAEQSSAPTDTNEASSERELEPAETSPRSLTDAQRFERAAALEAQNPASAVRMYQRLARGGGAWAEAALFAAGRLELETGSQDAGERSLRRYLQRYPSGVNARDARSLLGQR